MAGARAATGDGMIDLVVPGRPTGSSASGRLRKTQDKDGRADDQAPPPLPGLFVCPFAESLGCVGCYFGFSCCVVAVGCGCLVVCWLTWRPSSVLQCDLSFISVLSQFLSQFYLSFISVLKRRYFLAFRSYLTPNSR